MLAGCNVVLMLASCNDVFFDAVYSILLAIIGVALLAVGCVLMWPNK